MKTPSVRAHRLRRALTSVLPLSVMFALASGCSGRDDPWFARDGALQDGDPALTGRVVKVSSKTPAPKLHPGDVAIWTIVSGSLSIQNSVSWSAPSVHGDALRRIASRKDEATEEGGSRKTEYAFLAVKPGTTTLNSSAQSDAGPSEVATKAGGSRREDSASVELVVVAP